MLANQSISELLQTADETARDIRSLTPIFSPKSLSKTPHLKYPKNMIELAAFKKKESKFEVKNYSPLKSEAKIVRRDINGIVIKRKNKKKIKVTFNDMIGGDRKLVEYINIESFKEYNKIAIIGDLRDYNSKEQCSCECKIL